MAQNIPEKMRALVLDEFHADIHSAIRSLRVLERAVPRPRRGQVLVRIDAAPVNPSDLLLLQGQYGSLKTLPTVPGWEGAGTVVASGGGLYAAWLRGKRVACALRGNREGTWAEYFVADAKDCIPLKATVPIDQGASLIINPMTAVAIVETAQRAGHTAAVHTAGASQLGRMLLPIAAEMNFPLINMVRRTEQADLLKSLGARFVLDTSQGGFAEELKALCAKLYATAAFEAVAGEMTGIVLNAMPPKSTVYLYGALSRTPCGSIDPIGVIFHDKSLTGFFLGNWTRKRGNFGVLRAAAKVQRLIASGRVQTTIQRRLSFDQAKDGMLQYVDHMTEGKVLLTPHRDSH